MPATRRIRRRRIGQRHIYPKYNYAAYILETGARERYALGKPLTRGFNLNSDKAISVIGMHWHAMRIYIHGSGTKKHPKGRYPPGTTKFLRILKRKYGDPTIPGWPLLITIEAGTFELETDLKWIRAYAEFGLFQEGEELDFDTTISSPKVTKVASGE